MNDFIRMGVMLVVLALISYTIFFATKSKNQKLRALNVSALTLGVALDLCSTIFMIMGSNNGPITFHGMIGYSALVGMIIETVLIWRKYTSKNVMSAKLYLYTNIIYGWWIIVFIAGGVMTALGYQ